MNSILAVEKGLPPGLWLPTADEPTEQYLSENFAYLERDYEDIIDYGAFIVSRVLSEQDNTGRVSMMPVYTDIDEIHSAGYGVSTRALQRKYGGIRRLQRALGFYPKGFVPTAEDLLQRFQWIADYAYGLDPYDTPLRHTEQIMQWGSERNLTPRREIVFPVLGNPAEKLRPMFGLPEFRYSHLFTALDVYRFGAKVIEENGIPVSQSELKKKYAGQLGTNPYQTIISYFGTYTRFWLEFGYVSTTHGLTTFEIVNLGLQKAIANGGVDLNSYDIEQQSLEKRFSSREPIYNHFGGVKKYRERIEAEYERYLRFSELIIATGVSYEVVRAFCQRFEAAPEFEEQLKNNIGVLQKLSAGTQDSRYVLSVAQKGFNLLDEQIMEMQMEDFLTCLSRLGITGRPEQHFIFSTVPRINADEALRRRR